jgi:hypothetical protein
MSGLLLIDGLTLLDTNRVQGLLVASTETHLCCLTCSLGWLRLCTLLDTGG